MKTQMLRWDNSLVVRIPKSVARDAKLKQGDWLEITAIAKGLVKMRKITRIPTLERLVRQITRDNRYAEISAGAEVGKEEVEW